MRGTGETRPLLPARTGPPAEIERGFRAINSRLKYTVKYTAIHCFYWSVCCSSGGFVAVYMLSLHYTNSQIGLAVAAINFASAFLQPVVAEFADRSRKLFLKNFFIAFLGAACLLAAVRFLAAGAPPFFLVLSLVLELIVLWSLQPLVISLGIRITDLGVPINFSLARGTGSMAFAVTAVLLGFLIDRKGPSPLAGVSVALYIVLGVLVFTFAKERDRPPQAGPPLPAAAQDRQPDSRPVRPAKNKKFLILMAAVVLTFCSYSIICNFLIQITEHVGGSAKEMGIASGLSAAIEMPSMILFGVLVKRFRCSTILKCSLFFFVVKSILTLTAASVPALYAAQMFQSCAYAQFTPASVFYVNQVVGKDNMVKGQAFMTGAATLGSVAASLIGGWLLDGPGVSAMLAVGTAFALLGFAVGCFSIQKTGTVADA